MRAVFGIGEGELALILIFAFMIFGPDKLPGMGRTLGRALRQFKNAQEGFTQVVQTNIVDPAAEAMGADGKKPNRDRQAELDEDADLDGSDDAPRARRSETFAERKQRLAAEKAERDAAAALEREKAAEKADATDAADAATDASAGAADAVADADADAAEPVAEKPEPAAEEPRRRTAADLYAMRRPAAEPQAAEPAATADAAEPAAADGTSNDAADAATDADATKEA